MAGRATSKTSMQFGFLGFIADARVWIFDKEVVRLKNGDLHNKSGETEDTSSGSGGSTDQGELFEIQFPKSAVRGLPNPPDLDNPGGTNKDGDELQKANLKIKIDGAPETANPTETSINAASDSNLDSNLRGSISKRKKRENELTRNQWIDESTGHVIKNHYETTDFFCKRSYIFQKIDVIRMDLEGRLKISKVRKIGSI